MPDEPSILDYIEYVPAGDLVLPEPSRRALELLAADKVWWRRQFIARGISADAFDFEKVWPHVCDLWLTDETREAARFLALCVRAADAGQRPLILSLN